MSAPRYRHQPKGMMCATCSHRHRDCSSLPFHTMPVMLRRPEVVVVRCTDYQRDFQRKGTTL